MYHFKFRFQLLFCLAGWPASKDLLLLDGTPIHAHWFNWHQLFEFQPLRPYILAAGAVLAGAARSSLGSSDLLRPRFSPIVLPATGSVAAGPSVGVAGSPWSSATRNERVINFGLEQLLAPSIDLLSS